ncbi:uncharacterized protein BP5553_07837 [Venustampulla echinocandica]|uniref:Uncharacterized protein n=1 Tax=Venustampulla echinocandica TaxID=2656787 RepID=A0A370THN3_9HELO|nr:uncharacterized protein BP5553_07837 [Venustampulla echinocandica]RDL34709.1 hypothetical protein BP5553_07837 [Venustampulla echinocandica]
MPKISTSARQPGAINPQASEASGLSFMILVASDGGGIRAWEHEINGHSSSTASNV